jgi:aspartate/methionine/tyrosine aminotransferase
MTGFRIGWAVGNRRLIAAMARIQSHQTSGPSVLGQVAAVAALDGDQGCVEALRITLERNRDLLLDRLETLAHGTPEEVVLQALEILEEHRGRIQMVHRNVKETLDLTGVKVHGQHPRRSCHCNQIGNEFGRNGCPR